MCCAIDKLSCLSGPAFLKFIRSSRIIICLIATKTPNEVIIGGTGGQLERLKFRSRPSSSWFSSWEPVQDFVGHCDHVCAVAVSRGGRLLASGFADNTVMVWDEDCSEALVKRSFAGYAEVCAISICPAGIVIWGDDLGMIRISSTRRMNKGITEMKGHEGRINALTISRDGSAFVSGGKDGSIKVWDMERKRCVRALHAGMTPIRALAWCRCWPLIVPSGDNGIIRQWDVYSGIQVGKPMCGPYARVHSLAVSSNGFHVVLAGLTRPQELGAGAQGVR